MPSKPEKKPKTEANSSKAATKSHGQDSEEEGMFQVNSPLPNPPRAPAVSALPVVQCGRG